MNNKASVSKNLSEKHSKILEGLVRRPENKECADCQTKAPRWASVNLGIFICMRCSGIHRSLGTHISQVRSTTLDTWLPEQVAFMQAVGNENSNNYWEAMLPSNYDKRGIERFINEKYVGRKWVSRNTTQPSLRDFSKSDDNQANNIGIPGKPRKFSLEEEILTSHVNNIVVPPPKIRGGSMDMGFIYASQPQRERTLVTNSDRSSPRPNRIEDTRNSDYVLATKKDRPLPPPNNWITFDYHLPVVKRCLLLEDLLNLACPSSLKDSESIT